MLTIAKLFGKSPFAPLQTHMKKVSSCIDKLESILSAIHKRQPEKILALVNELSEMEQQADMTKNDIRNHLPKSIFMPIDRSHFLEILSIQDSIADKAEEVALTLSLKNPAYLDELAPDLIKLFSDSHQTFLHTKKIIAEIDELLESSFGGVEAERVKEMVEQTAAKESITQKEKHNLLKKLFAVSDDFPASNFSLLLKVIEMIADIAHLSERLANRIRMVLEIK